MSLFPEIYFVASDSVNGDICILMEDLGNESPGNNLDGISTEGALVAPSSIGNFHAKSWNSNDLCDMKWLNPPLVKERFLKLIVRKSSLSFFETYDGTISSNFQTLLEKYPEKASYVLSLLRKNRLP